MSVTRASKKRPGGRSRRPPSEQALPKAKEPKLLDVTGMRRDIDYDRLRERVDLLESTVTDHGDGIAQVKRDAGYWSGISTRVKMLEEKPDPVVVDKDGKAVPVPVATIALAFFIHDLVLGALIFGAYWVARGAGWHLPPGWL